MADFPPAGAFEYLRTQAIARLYLDNIPNIQSSWVTQGPKIGQLALFFGANDMGSLMIEENVVASAGTVHYLTLEQIKRSIREAGYVPRQRNVFYEYIDAGPAAANVPDGSDRARSAPTRRELIPREVTPSGPGAAGRCSPSGRTWPGSGRRVPAASGTPRDAGMSYQAPSAKSTIALPRPVHRHHPADLPLEPLQLRPVRLRP